MTLEQELIVFLRKNKEVSFSIIVDWFSQKNKEEFYHSFSCNVDIPKDFIGIAYSVDKEETRLSITGRFRVTYLLEMFQLSTADLDLYDSFLIITKTNETFIVGFESNGNKKVLLDSRDNMTALL